MDLIQTLSEPAILILRAHKEFDRRYNKKYLQHQKLSDIVSDLDVRLRAESRRAEEGMENNLEHVFSEMDRASNEEEKIRKQLDKLEIFRTEKYYSLTKSDFLYHKQILYSKGLLIDRGINRQDQEFEIMGITEFGRNFINFIIHK